MFAFNTALFRTLGVSEEDIQAGVKACADLNNPENWFDGTPVFNDNDYFQMCKQLDLFVPCVAPLPEDLAVSEKKNLVILIPEWVREEMTAGELEGVKWHEAGHIAHGDMDAQIAGTEHVHVRKYSEEIAADFYACDHMGAEYLKTLEALIRVGRGRFGIDDDAIDEIEERISDCKAYLGL